LVAQQIAVFNQQQVAAGGVHVSETVPV